MTNSSSSTTLFNGYIASVINLDALRNFPTDNLSTGAAIIVAGSQYLGDGNGGLFSFDATSVSPDDGLAVIQPSSGTGRWLLSAGRGNDAARTLYDAGVINAPTTAAFEAYIVSQGASAAVGAQAAANAASLSAQSAQGSQAAAVASVVSAQTAQSAAMTSAANAQASANAASSYSLAVGIYPAAYATALPQGVTGLTGGVGTGTGGTAGTYVGGVSGGPTGFAWSYAVDGTGKISAVTIINPGLSTSTAAPTLTYSGGGGVTGATVPGVVVGNLVTSGNQYWSISNDNTKLLRWANNGTSTPAAINTGSGAQLQFAIDPTTAVSTVQQAISTWNTQTPTISETGKYLNTGTGVITANAGWNYAKYALTGTENGVRATGNPGPQALAIFFNSSGTYISSSSLTSGPYANQTITVPNGTATIGINSRATFALSLDTLTPASTLGQRVQTVETKLTADEAKLASVQTAVSDWNAVNLNIVAGSYFSRTNPGTQNPLANFQSALYPINGSEGGIRATAQITGTGTALAVYFSNPDGTGFIGYEGDGTDVVNGIYQQRVLTVPANARSIGITSRSTTLVLETFGPVAISSFKQNSLWNGRKWTSDGDSITNFGYWQPFVNLTHKFASWVNTGVGGTRLSLSASNPSADTVSMCSDTRIATIPADTQLLTCLPGMNDWAQNIPLGSFDNGDPTTYYGAIQAYVQKATARIPATARLMMMTTTYGQFIQWQSRGFQSAYLNGIGLSTYDYAEALRIACRQYGVPVIDTSGGIGWNRFNIASFVGTEVDANSAPYAQIHPTTVGAKRMAEIVNGRLWDIQPLL